LGFGARDARFVAATRGIGGGKVMFHVLKHRRLVWLGMGLVGGLILCGVWPQTPLHAVATDRSETFAVATGFVDEGIEAVYFLDFLTGDLSAVVWADKAGDSSPCIATTWSAIWVLIPRRTPST
jgi:hypothetical protein